MAGFDADALVHADCQRGSRRNSNFSRRRRWLRHSGDNWAQRRRLSSAGGRWRTRRHHRRIFLSLCGWLHHRCGRNAIVVHADNLLRLAGRHRLFPCLFERLFLFRSASKDTGGKHHGERVHTTLANPQIGQGHFRLSFSIYEIETTGTCLYFTGSVDLDDRFFASSEPDNLAPLTKLLPAFSRPEAVLARYFVNVTYFRPA